ncbi:hypothetical protein O6H91_05G122500 [Diphasiastrum complanatum]|uniref:Uncharacterized protein n=7 Tax=Diphasiastrum complanatum TaxID=34168 RepID=A0ACC2DSN3_DIPCM|nr:hypothetical protein O6H91_05G122500 [Diphasiastrum complanatum]KAJ7557336.1 hypothetical protein O6H91_05G122500 [Diphasiastrum complanatum]KAJ7557337.1 hypothetical protein O6H91_05G122500 [Diphasiastrum complanatum]KAJ7557338.1 hypothetical protein O6H91_05G122500 [Diphasiastrum complanatum]KAJ7557339.1 hypothetical protein O6H91_05G122500 [Diphasiastrum complanatum]
MASLRLVSFQGTLLRALGLLAISAFVAGTFVGVNYGTDGDNLPTPQQVVDFMKKQGISQVRIFDTNAAILQAFAGSNIQIIVGIPNEEILSVGQSNATAANWVKKNVAIYLPSTNITGIAVGSEVLTDYTTAASVLVPTMKYIYAALVAANLDSQIKVSTPHATSLMLDSFPPSQAFFNQTYAKSVMQPLLDFLSQTGSYFMLNIYPLALYQQNRQVMSIDFALFRPNTGAVDSNTNLLYNNVFDSMLDAAFSAMAALNHSDLSIVVSESGWPSRGDMNEVGVSSDNAETYNSNLVKHVLNNTGTPQKPGISVNTYIYEIFNEDRREGATSEKNYGVFYPDMTPVYALDITGTGAVNTNGTSNRTWCVAKLGASDTSLQAALDFACGQGNASCAAIQPGQSCFNPNTVRSHASYAFDSYYQKQGMSPGSCDFRGVATVTTTDPSYGQCLFPSSIQANQTGAGNVKNNAAGLSTASFISSMSLSLFVLMSF